MNMLMIGFGLGIISGWTGAITYVYYSQKKLLGNRWNEFNDLLNYSYDKKRGKK